MSQSIALIDIAPIDVPPIPAPAEDCRGSASWPPATEARVDAGRETQSKPNLAGETDAGEAAGCAAFWAY